MSDLTIDDKGFLRVGRAKAPFKFDPRSGTIEFVEKNPHRRPQPDQREIPVTLAQLAELSQSERSPQLRSSPQEQAGEAAEQAEAETSEALPLTPSRWEGEQ